MSLQDILKEGIEVTQGNEKAQAWVKRLCKEVSKELSTDRLTGVFNRRYLEEMSEEERRKNSKNGFGVIMLDIDNFHNYNETYGHPQGDIALKTVAQCINTQVREGDVCRYGGEEFLVLCYGADLSQTTMIAERIRASVESTKILENKSFKTSGYETVTVTAGVSVLERDKLEQIEDVLARADKSLMEGKKTAKNKVYY